MFPARHTSDAETSAAAPAAAPVPPAGFASLPQALVRHILAHLAVNERARSATVHPSWRDALADPAMWSVLDLSRASGIARSRVTEALLRGALERAGDQLTSLDLRDCYHVKFEDLFPLLVTKSCALLLQVVHLQQRYNVPDSYRPETEYRSFHGHSLNEVEALLRAAPRLELVHADMQLDCGPLSALQALQVLRNEGRFAPLRLEYLVAALDNATPAGVVELMAVLPSHVTLTGLELRGARFLEEPEVLEAIVTSALTSHLTKLVLYDCGFGPEYVPSLAHLLSSTSLSILRIEYDELTDIFCVADVAVFANALRTNSTLKLLALINTDLWYDAPVGAAVFASLVAHRSLRTFIWRENYVREHKALVGIALHALVAANAPALRYLDVGVILGDDALGPLFDALPRNTHLYSLDCETYLSTSLAFVRDVLLPAVRANTSLRRLFDVGTPRAEDADTNQILLDTAALVNSRGGLPADEFQRS